MTSIRSLLAATCMGIACSIPCTAVAAEQEGMAAHYSDRLQGHTTASGEPYDKNAMTAAHHTLPFGTRVTVTYLKTGKTVEVVINDRIARRNKVLIDVSGAAAEELGLTQEGIGKVKITYADQ